MNAIEVCATRPIEVFPAWLPAQRVAGRHATIPLPSIAALRSRGFLPQALAARIADWYAGPPIADAREIEIAYEALADEVAGELRQQRTMSLRAASADRPHPVLDDQALDQVRRIHDVLGHAALGLGFDLQSEYAAWLYCRPLFSRAARPAAFCELVGAVTSYVLTGTKPILRADLPPASLRRAPRLRSGQLRHRTVRDGLNAP